MLMLSVASFGAIRGVVPRGLPIAGAEATSPTARSNVSATVWKMDMAVEVDARNMWLVWKSSQQTLNKIDVTRGGGRLHSVLKFRRLFEIYWNGEIAMY